MCIKCHRCTEKWTALEIRWSKNWWQELTRRLNWTSSRVTPLDLELANVAMSRGFLWWGHCIDVAGYLSCTHHVPERFIAKILECKLDLDPEYLVFRHCAHETLVKYPLTSTSCTAMAELFHLEILQRGNTRPHQLFPIIKSLAVVGVEKRARLFVRKTGAGPELAGTFAARFVRNPVTNSPNYSPFTWQEDWRNLKLHIFVKMIAS